MFHALAGRGRLLLLVPVPSFQPLIRARGTKSGGDLRTSSGTAAKRAAAATVVRVVQQVDGFFVGETKAARVLATRGVNYRDEYRYEAENGGACHDVEEDSQHFHDFVIARVVNGRFAGGGYVGFGCRFATRGALDGISAAGASRDVCAAGHICSVAEVHVKQQPERDQDQECCAKETPRGQHS